MLTFYQPDLNTEKAWDFSMSEDFSSSGTEDADFNAPVSNERITVPVCYRLCYRHNSLLILTTPADILWPTRTQGTDAASRTHGCSNGN